MKITLKSSASKLNFELTGMHHELKQADIRSQNLKHAFFVTLMNEINDELHLMPFYFLCFWGVL